MMFKRCF